MRRMILTSLVLLPVMAHAQVSTSSATKSLPSSAMNEAELTQPVAATELALKSASEKPAVPAATAGMSELARPLFRESIQMHSGQDAGDAALLQGGTLEFTMGSVPTESSAPKLTRPVELALSNGDLAEQPAISTVVVHAIVDENGFPRAVSVTRSATPVLDRKAVQAVSKYRFAPATLDNKATWASVSIAIRIEKQ